MELKLRVIPLNHRIYKGIYIDIKLHFMHKQIYGSMPLFFNIFNSITQFTLPRL